MGDETNSLDKIKEVFKPCYDEIERRKTSDNSEQKYFEKTSGSDNSPFKLQDQVFFLFSISSEKIPPCSTTSTNPAIRIYGCFATENDAKEHAQEVMAIDPKCSLFIDETHKWIVTASSISRMQDEKLIGDIITDRLKEYLSIRMHDNKEFDSAIQGGEVERTTRPEYEEKPIVTNEKARSHKLKSGSDVRGQKYAIIVFLPDESTGEPVFVVYGCMETREEADAWVRNIVGRNVTEYDLHIVSTCEWLFLNRMQGNGAQSHKYRTPELEKIMEKQRNAPEEIKEYEELYGFQS